MELGDCCTDYKGHCKGEKENCSYGGVLCDFHLLLVLGGVVSVSLRKKSDGVDLTV